MKQYYLGIVLILLFALQPVMGQAPAPFAIHVVDDATGRGVPLVTLTTTNSIRYITDSNGWIAFDEPGLLGLTVYFKVTSPGYSYPADGFGFHGVRLVTKPGGEATIKIHRDQIAQRLYRITGQGIYSATVRLGRDAPITHPLLDAGVLGQDSVSNTVYHGKMFWFWGDTTRASYPLGNFRMTGATSLLPNEGGLDPSVGVNLNYFESKDGKFVHSLFDLGKKGVVWGTAPMVLKLPDGKEHMVMYYTRRPGMKPAYAKGLGVWNDKTQMFEKRVDIPLDARLHPIGSEAFKYTDHGTTYFYFSSPYPLVRVKADWKHVSDPTVYEAYTPLVPGTAYAGAKSKIERDDDGHVVYGWKKNTGWVSVKGQAALIKAGLLKKDEAWINMHAAKTGKEIGFASGTVHWNNYRKKWIMIACQVFGEDSVLGNMWYSEADSLVGPWKSAVRIAVHPHYSFYNVVQHPLFDQEDGRIIYFEGTYTATFSGNKHSTPRYNYNQMMYQLDLSDPRLKLQPVTLPASK